MKATEVKLLQILSSVSPFVIPMDQRTSSLIHVAPMTDLQHEDHEFSSLGSSFWSCRFAVSESRRVQTTLAHHLIQAGSAPGQLSGEEQLAALRLLEERA